MPTFRSVALAVTAIASHAAALVLQELPHSDGLKYSKRGDPMGCLDLKSQETFMWGASDETQAALGNLTVYMPGDEENIVSMERFNGMLTSVNCTETSIDMGFRDGAGFAYAKAVWDWVNGADNHTFVMVAGVGACGNAHRQPFTVSTLTYDDDANVAHLAAVAQNWTEAIHTYDLNVGGVPQSSTQKRSFGEIDYDKSLSLDFNHPFPVDTVSLPMPSGISATLDLSNCSTAGAFAFTFTLETILLIPKKAELSVQPQGVAVTIAPSLELSGNITTPDTASLTLDRINLAGYQIPGGILDIGPEVILSLDATLGPLEGHATIEAGVVISLEDSAVASVDILSMKADQSGWTPDVRTTPLTVDAELSATMKAAFTAELALVAKAFSTGFDIGIKLSPYVQADLQTVTAQSGSCGTSDGLVLDPSYGIDLVVEADTPAEDPLFSITLASLSEPLPSVCLPFNNAGNAPSSPVVSPTPSASAIVIPSAVPSSLQPSPSAPASSSVLPLPVMSPSSSSSPVVASSYQTSVTAWPAYATSTFSTVITSSAAPSTTSVPAYNGGYSGYGGYGGY